ncbi:hypothetical protein [Novosphingobium sp. SG707]|uniref:hypothetical protein n=1 Tax=Novosphingobium sp. SG707 TaxID=2586996 RepID=UPI001447F669|nr:hypothetical protein [Novosphingobium sp. SG707]NKJ01647.1 hypothetical protein [Novosphingobium sp. SG707]
MKRWILGAIPALGCLMGALPVAGKPVAATAVACDRGCLLDKVHEVLLGLEAHDASKLVFTPNALIYRNGSKTDLKDGIWQDATIITGRSTFVSPVDKQAVFMGVVRRRDADPALYFLRLKIEGRKISEMEEVVAGPKDLLYDPTGVHTPKPMWSDVLLRNERVPAHELRHIADLYFQSIQEHNPAIVPFHPDCNRTENGTPTTNTNKPGVITSDSCDIGVTKFGWIPHVRERRYPLTDEARGIVVGISRLDVEPGLQSNNGPKSDHPFSFIIYEIFKIVDGRILDIECFMITPEGHPAVWPLRK